MPLIELAMEGRAEYLRAINGVPDPDRDEPGQESGTGADLVAYLRRRAQG